MTSSPLHIAIIPDGNRRWARARLWRPWKGHEVSAANFKTLLEWCRKDERIGTLTFWCLSTENWKRGEEEVSKLMELLENYLTNEGENMLKNGIRLLHSGRRERLPDSLITLIDQIGEKTAKNDRLTLHLAIDYGGKDEVMRAMNRIEKRDITEDDIRAHLDHPELPDIDLVIRTAGERRTSNFFLWQTAYAEWLFSEKLFPDFGTEDLKHALDDFESRTRRYGA